MIIEANQNLTRYDDNMKQIYQLEFDMWVDWIFKFEYQAMTITYLMYCSWMFTFQHIYEAVFAAKNKKVS